MNYDLQRLVGRKIASIHWMSSMEADRNGWLHRAPVFRLDDGTEFYPQSFTDAAGLGVHDDSYHPVAPRHISRSLLGAASREEVA